MKNQEDWKIALQKTFAAFFLFECNQDDSDQKEQSVDTFIGSSTSNDFHPHSSEDPGILRLHTLYQLERRRNFYRENQRDKLGYHLMQHLQ
jgi:hypothetical protein